ncbi:sugar transferase [Pseudoroseicyclus aestuarii]|uniref:Lipopolysaccharide/colanic/teichoic acid biosynthesis glycosyltransferase n=1 Tax=Pseudoroseicyclus aestuarii TaxID=1795041 RepID=A0A318T8W2_9RHOB|nr:sugar transferase [Pseudoroseicyclus aestuarii]PYE84808.1 lipopolysaccharide/colanic/teichoic acid biosynthesis glycosyltransferase [Pseudoroseicyclus aestuarii]
MTASKRALDLGLSLLLAAVLAPLLLVLIALLWATEGRPIFYIAERMKTPQQPFALVKLRTMRPSPPGTEAGVTGGDKSARMSRLHRLLRASRADEIPQLWNVIRGDMSLVGPRPPLRLYVEAFPETYARVLRSRPGVTGLASLRFHAHEERLLAACRSPEETDAVYRRRCVPRKATLDLIYASRRSLCFDLALIGETARRPLQGLFRRGRRGETDHETTP